MIAMQYAIALPADYDMGVIRDRVATRGAAMDDFPGLGLKAYGIRERGVHGAPVNEYSPFYFWTAPEGMNAFLWGPGFAGICADFGRPVVQYWTVLALHAGAARATTPAMFTREVQPIDADADLTAVVDGALEHAEARAGRRGVHTTAVGIDPRGWELLHFTLWEGAAPDVAGSASEVLHLSAPGLGALRPGRRW